MEEEERIKEEIANFNEGILQFGYRDVEVAIKTALEVGENGNWVAEQVENYIDSTEVKLNDVDVVCSVYDSILQECRNEIKEYTNKDIWNDLKDIVEVAGNYMCTQFDGTEEAIKETLKLARKVPKEERSNKLKWFIKQLEDMY